MKIAFMGTGLLGSPMAERLIRADHTVSVYNRTKAKAEHLSELGAKVVDSAEGAIIDSECIILVLADKRAIDEVLFSESSESLDGKTVIQMGTIAPFESIELQKKVYALNGDYFECPVLGSRKEASEGSLILLVGATQEKFDQWGEFLKVFGPYPRHAGEVGQAAALKLALNQLIASHAAAFSLSLGIVEKNNVSVELFTDILKGSSLIAPMYEKKLKNWIERDYENPNFPAKHLLKDVQLIIQEAKDKGLSTDVLEAISNILEQTIQQGLGEKDYSSLFNTINGINQ